MFSPRASQSQNTRPTEVVYFQLLMGSILRASLPPATAERAASKIRSYHSKLLPPPFQVGVSLMTLARGHEHPHGVSHDSSTSYYVWQYCPNALPLLGTHTRPLSAVARSLTYFWVELTARITNIEYTIAGLSGRICGFALQDPRLPNQSARYLNMQPFDVAM